MQEDQLDGSMIFEGYHRYMNSAKRKGYSGTMVYTKKEPLSVSYEIDAIDVSYLEDCNIAQINAYHKMVYDRLSPYLDEEEKAWLAHETREITR